VSTQSRHFQSAFSIRLKLEVGRYLGLIARSRDRCSPHDSPPPAPAIAISTSATSAKCRSGRPPSHRSSQQARQKTSPAGWAVVDNTVGEDWNNVELSHRRRRSPLLHPATFRTLLSRRPVVPLPESVRTLPANPRRHTRGGNGRLSGTITDATGASIPGASCAFSTKNGTPLSSHRYRSSRQLFFLVSSVGNYRLESQRPGFKSTRRFGRSPYPPAKISLTASSRVGTPRRLLKYRCRQFTEHRIRRGELKRYRASGVANRIHVYSKLPASPPPPAPSAANLALPREILPLHSVKTRRPLRVQTKGPRHPRQKISSALVPIAQTDIEAESFRLWSGTRVRGAASRLVGQKTSPLTLDAGSFSVLESEVSRVKA